MSNKLILMYSIDFDLLDPHLQKQIYDQFYQLVYKKVFFIVNEHAATEDVIQEAFIRVLQKPPQTIDEKLIQGWLMTVTRWRLKVFISMKQLPPSRNCIFHNMTAGNMSISGNVSITQSHPGAGNPLEITYEVYENRAWAFDRNAGSTTATPNTSTPASISGSFGQQVAGEYYIIAWKAQTDGHTTVSSGTLDTN